MLPYDILTLALDSYLPSDGGAPDTDPFLSPLCASNDLLQRFPASSCFLSAALDPLLDDGSRFISRLKEVGKVPQWFLYDLPHGFLNFSAILPSATLAIERGSKYLAQVFQ